ncbi:MAG TPA: c-type cytochrome, partial [Woeseiaceae bacterium]|nr:c-type cytochrome [Woeseiaceae bacterium]
MKNLYRVVLASATIMLVAIGPAACTAGEATGQAQSSDTRVHDAEVLRGEALEELLEHGQEVYLANCAACHQPAGTGLPGA